MNQLHPKETLIFEAIVGSHAHGTNIETSDIDKKGVFIQPLEFVLGHNKYREQIKISKDNSLYEVKRFIELLSTNTPTVLEMLFSPKDCITHKSKIFDILIENKDKFITKQCKNSFGKYALGQINKATGLNKKANYEKNQTIRKSPIDFCKIAYEMNSTTAVPLNHYLNKHYMNPIDHSKCFLIQSNLPNCFDLYVTMYNEVLIENGFKVFGIVNDKSTEVKYKSKEILFEMNKFLKEKHDYVLEPHGIVHYNRDAYSKHCKSYNEYQTWLKERNVDRYIVQKEHGQTIDSKNMLHCRRLMDIAIEIAETGTFNVRRPNRDYLLSIRRGEVNLQDILYKAREDLKSLDSLYEKSNLPNSIDEEFLNDILLEIREIKYVK